MKLHHTFLIKPRSSLGSKTGSWRLSRPILVVEQCTGCGLCALYCPDACILTAGDAYAIDYDYCKGCGICAHECPAGAIHMEPEEG